MNRTDRLYAIVEELRAISPRPRSARWLADRFEVSKRTVERDVGALQQSGLPIYAEPGRTGGYVLDKAHSLPPLNITAGEAVAVAVALERLRGTPFHEAARSALAKVVAVMPERDAATARELAQRIQLVEDRAVGAPVPGVVAEALARRQVLRFGYRDRVGAVTCREVEPIAYFGSAEHWYLLAWCRLRDAARAFRCDRIQDPALTGEAAPAHPLDPTKWEVPHAVRAVAWAN